MGNVSLDVDISPLLHALIQMGGVAAKACAQALNEEGQLIFAESQDRVPVHFGTLQDSGVLDTARVIGDDIVVEMGYGGAASEYALIVHEMPESNNFTTVGTGPKYLEIPVLEHADALPKRIHDRLTEKLNGAMS